MYRNNYPRGSGRKKDIMYARDYLPLREDTYDTTRWGTVVSFHGVSVELTGSPVGLRVESLDVGRGPKGSPEFVDAPGGIDKYYPGTEEFQGQMDALKRAYTKIVSILAHNPPDGVSARGWAPALANITHVLGEIVGRL
jgi:hypothetical protein